MGHISDLPSELLDKVFEKLPLSSQYEAKGVCKLWKKKLCCCKTRAREGWIVVSSTQGLLWYNVSRNRWVKELMDIGSLPIQVQHSQLCGIVDERLFFCDRWISWWNVNTDEFMVLESEPLNLSLPQLGGYTDEKTGKLNLLLVNKKNPPEMSKLWRCEVEKKKNLKRQSVAAWKSCSWNPRELCYGRPNLNNLSSSNRVVPMGSRNAVLYSYHADEDCYQTTSPSGGASLAIKEDSGRFYFPGLGSYVIEESGGLRRRLLYSDLPLGLRVVWYEKFEVVSRSPEGLVESMREEWKTSLTGRWRTSLTGRWRSFFFCSDGVENIWALLWGCSRMLCYNVATKEWSTLPSILHTGIDTSEAWYTAF